jgi:quercetin dioxygenase-like cupin family protein
MQEVKAAPLVRLQQEAPPKPVPGTRGASMAVLVGEDEGAPGFVMRRFTLAPGGIIPAHRHPDIEHEQVVERGEMVLTLDGAEHVVRAGDSIFIPAGTAHRYENRGAGEVAFICVIPLTRGYQTEWLEPTFE